ncbi:MAG: TadG family pilus assembly protein [Planctomycetota bacterium]|nr:TadG family pilus assembly protein [Planctomycetota bacterium]
MKYSPPNSIEISLSRSLQSTRHQRRAGSIIVLASILMIAFIAVAALSVDLGYVNNVQSELDRAVDAAALASAGTLIDGQAEAQQAAVDYVSMNSVGAGFDSNDVEFETGHWNDTTRTFTPSTSLPSAVRVKAVRNDQRPMFFGKALQREAFPIKAEAVALFQPRDIMVALDFSGSMNDDSEFKSFTRLGQAAVEANQAQIYAELGAPVLGTLAMVPSYMVVKGLAPDVADKPQIYVEYRFNEVVVSSTKSFHKIRAYRNSSSYIESTDAGTYDATTGLYSTTLTYPSQQVTRVYVESGYVNSSHLAANQYTENIYFDTSTKIRNHAKDAFALNGVTYPYPGGSWDSWIDYVRSSSRQNATAGYRYRFGYRNWVNYLLEQQESSTETPDLWQTSEQPVTALKNAMTVFVSYLQEVDTDDQMGLSIYNSVGNDAILEHGLSFDLPAVESTTQHRQAGHYTSLTNIGAGLRVAIDEMQAHSRVGSSKLIVLMTDGVANRPTDTTTARAYVVTQANRAASFGYKVAAISLGAGADTSLLDQVAEITGGVHFNVPGGSTVAALEDQLKSVFHQIAADRPLRLVK